MWQLDKFKRNFTLFLNIDKNTTEIKLLFTGCNMTEDKEELAAAVEPYFSWSKQEGEKLLL